jgi:hypothetical protein
MWVRMATIQCIWYHMALSMIFTLPYGGHTGGRRAGGQVDNPGGRYSIMYYVQYTICTVCIIIWLVAGAILQVSQFALL